MVVLIQECYNTVCCEGGAIQIQLDVTCKVCGFHSSVAEDSVPPGYDTS